MAGGVTCRASPPQEGGPRCTPCLYRQAILGRIRPVLVSHAVDLATATTSHDDGRAKPTSPLAQHSLRQLERQVPTRQTTNRSWTQGAITPTRPAQPCGGLPTAALPNLTSTGHRGRGDARTADAWTLRRPHRTLDTGRVDRQAWTLVAGTGHWTPDAGRGRGQGDDGTAGIQTSWTTTPGDRALGRPTVFLWTGPAGLGSPCRLGRRSPAGARLPLALPCSARPLRRH